MATLEEVSNWIIANEDKAGTPEFEAVANEYKRLRYEDEEIGGEDREETTLERLAREDAEEEAFRESLFKTEKVEEEEPGFGDQIEEFFKGIPGGAAGLLESAALGGATVLDEDEEDAARKAILGVSDPVREFFSADKGSEELVGRKFGEALGSFLGIAVAALIPKIGLPAAIALAVGAGSGEASERARAANASPNERGRASVLGGLVGATELVNPLRLINAFKKGAGEEAVTGFFNRARRILREAGFEGLQEFAAGVGQNLIEQGIYNPEQGTFTDTGEQFGYGAGVGGFVQTFVELLSPKFRGRSAADLEPLLLEDLRTKLLEDQRDPKLLEDQRDPRLLEDQRGPIIGRDERSGPTIPLPGPIDADADAKSLQEARDRSGLAALTRGDVEAFEQPDLFPKDADVAREVEGIRKLGTKPTETLLEEQLQTKDEQLNLEDLIATTPKKPTEKEITESEIETITGQLDTQQQKITAEKRLRILQDVIEKTPTKQTNTLTSNFSKALLDAGIGNTTPTEAENRLIKRAIDFQRAEKPLEEVEAKQFQIIDGKRFPRTEIPELDKKRKGKGSVLPESKKVDEITTEGITDDKKIEKFDETAARIGTDTVGFSVEGKGPDVITKPAEGPAGTGTAGLDATGRPIDELARRETEQQDTLEEDPKKFKADFKEKSRKGFAFQMNRSAQKKREDLADRLSKVQTESSQQRFFTKMSRELDGFLKNDDSIIKNNMKIGKTLEEMESFVKELETTAPAAAVVGDKASTKKLTRGKGQGTVPGKRVKKDIGETLGKKGALTKAMEGEETSAKKIKEREAKKVKTEDKKEVKTDDKKEVRKGKKETLTAEQRDTKKIYGEKGFAALKRSPKAKRKELELINAIKAGVQLYDVVVKRDPKTGKTTEVEVKKKQVKTQKELFGEYVRDLNKPFTQYDDSLGINLSKSSNVFEESDIDTLTEAITQGNAFASQQTGESANKKGIRSLTRYSKLVDPSRPADIFILAVHDQIFADPRIEKGKETKEPRSYRETTDLDPKIQEYFARTGHDRAAEIIAWAQENLSAKANDFIKKVVVIERQDYLKQRDIRSNAVESKYAEIQTKKMKKKQEAENEQFDEFKNILKDKEQTIEEYMTTAEEIADTISNKEIMAIMDAEGKFIKKYLEADATESLSLPLHPSIISALKAGDLKLALEGLSATSLSKELRQVAKNLAKKVGTTSIKIEKNLISEDSVPVAGLFDPKTNTIKLDADTGFNPHVILHEMVHAVTSANLANKSHPTTKQLNTLFNDVKDMIDTAYGSKNLDEFVAESMSNPAFQAKLAGINPKGEPINAFQRLTNIVGNFLRRIVGLPTKKLDSALNRIDEIIDDIVTPAPEYRAAGAIPLISSRPELIKAINNLKSDAATTLDKSSFLSGVFDFLSAKIPKLSKQGLLISLPLQAIRDLAPKFNFKSSRAINLMKETQTTIESMVGDTGKIDASIDAAVLSYEGWFKKAEKNGQRELFDFVVYQGTTFGVDVDRKSRKDYINKDGTPRMDESGNNLLAKYDEIYAKWNKLDAEGKATYRDMREVYEIQRKKLQKVIVGEIERMDVEASVKKTLRDGILAKLFDKNKVEPYFPLTRKGEYWVEYKVKQGDSTEMAYEAFETSTARDSAIAKIKTDPNLVSEDSIKKYTGLSNATFGNAPSGSFVKDVLQVMKVNGVNEQVQEQILRMFIDTLPATSFAKSFVLRKNSPGYLVDALGAFKQRGYDIGRQVSTIKYSKILQSLENDLIEEFKAQGKDEQAALYVEEVVKRIRFARNPPKDFLMRASAQANRIAFLGTIGFNVSSAIVNASQIPLMFQPILGGKYGHYKAIKSIGGASRLIFSSGIGREIRKITTPTGKVVDVGAMPSIDNYYIADANGNFVLRTDLKLTTEKRDELNEIKTVVQMAADRGQLNRSLFYDTLTLEEGGRARNLWDKTNAVSAFFFHQQEKLNRQVALISTYKLELNRLMNNPTAKERGLSTSEKQNLAAEEALYQAQQMNGGAALANAPRIAQIPLGRVALMYKSYGIQMYYTLIKTGLTAIDKNNQFTPEERRIARKQFVGIALSSATLAGISGMPFVGLAMMIANMFRDDEEEPAEFLANRMFGELAWKGPTSWALGTDVSGRIGLSNLLFRNNPYKKDDSLDEKLVTLLGGPAWSVFSQFKEGIKEINSEFGDTQRGMERMLPAAFRNFAKTYRYLDEGGIYTRRGDPIVTDVSGSGLLFQFLGFPPAEYIRAQEQNQVAKGIDKAVNMKRSQLLRKLYIELRHGHDTSEVFDEIRKFNKRHSRFSISGSSVQKSLKQHMKQTARMHNGVSLSPNMRRHMKDHDDLYFDLSFDD